MNKFRKLSLGFLTVFALVIVFANLYLINNVNKEESKAYRVDIERIASRLNAGENLEQIDLSSYESIISVEPYDKDEVCQNEYAVEVVGNSLYRFEYKNENPAKYLIFINAVFVFVFIAILVLLLYLDKKILSPFYRVEGITTELAKGNLTVPIRQEKSKYLSQFLWGLDMLRAKLEEEKANELKLAKENKTMVLSLSHDIKTPLSAIELYTKALKNNIYETSQEKEQALLGIEKNTSEIKAYIEKIAASQREDFLALEVKNTSLYLDEVLGSIKTYYEDKCTLLHIDFEVEKYSNCLIFCDRDRLIEALQNLVENAIKYGDGKFINIKISEEEDFKLISVINSGSQLKTEEMPHIFESFYRGSNTSKVPGSGLGLYICRSLLRKMGGDVYAKQSNGNFEVTLVVKKA